MRGKYLVLLIVATVLLTGCGKKAEQMSALANEGKEYFEQGKYNEAILKFDEAYKLKGVFVSSKEAAILLNKGFTQELMKDYSGAIETYTQVIQKEKRSATAYNQRAYCRMQQSEFEEAKEDLKKAQKYAKKNPTIYLNQCELAIMTEDEEWLNTLLNNVEELQSSTTEELLSQGKIYLLKKDYNKAKEYFQKAYDHDSQSVDALICLGRINIFLKQYDIAENYLQKAVEENITNTEAINELGVLYLNTGKIKEALKLFQQCISIDGETRRYVYNQIIACEKLAKYKDAYELMVDYIEKYPNDDEAKRELDYIKTRLPK